MQPLDIDAIIKKYSSPNWIASSKTNQGVGNGNAYKEHKNGLYPSSNQIWGQNGTRQGTKFDGSSYNSGQNSMNHQAFNEPPYWQNFSNYSKFNTDLGTQHHRSQRFQNDYNYNKPIEHIYEASNQYGSNFGIDKNNPSRHEQKIQNETWKLTTYQTYNPNDTLNTLNYRSTIPSFDMINQKNDFNCLQPDFSNRNLLNQSLKTNVRGTTLPQNDLMNAFSNEKITHLNLFNGPKIYLNQLVESKPQIAVNSPINQLQPKIQQNFQKQTTSKYQNQFITKPNQNWKFSSQQKTFNNFPHLQVSQMEDLSPKTNQKANNPREVGQIYRKVESATTNYTPNSEGFIPLHKTKEQLENDLYDLDDYESKEKKVYNGLQITEKIKTSKLENFKNTSFCGWKNNVMYDISTKDDNKNKFLLGKWC